MKESVYRWLVVVLLVVISAMELSAILPRKRLVVEKIRNVWDMEDIVKEQYSLGFRLLCIERLASDAPDAQGSKTEYVMFFEK